ncbi:tryptophan 2,3-dioxygenase family protein [uncultured Croceitalea sp.]|uniref:tryptophan 2,3-dioxygenase family protein n=1 Tax=uncultured Croceitalea sp. TaxID=1798908 RepID=UPI00374F1D41
MKKQADSNKYSTIHYHSYLALDKILDAQNLRSEAIGEPAHEEMLFIITHQAYELWFKQIVHEVESILKMFGDEQVDEHSVGTVISRIERIEKIMDLLIKQIEVMETMTPLDFLDFRNYLFPASGFQSFQFRMVESLLGLPEKERITYNNHHYAAFFPKEQQEQLDAIYANGTLFDAVEKWLERTPFIQFGEFAFLESYEVAVDKMVRKEQEAIKNSSYLSEDEIKMRLKMLGSKDTYFQSVLDKDIHSKLKSEGKLRFSYEATVAALFINLYRDEPILHLPFKLLSKLMEIDGKFTTWRYRHAQMVLRMLGKKIGTGGSSGHDYLNETALKHKFFGDLHNISTLLIPRSELPELPNNLKRELSFSFTSK